MSKARATGVAESDDEYAPPSQGAARGAKKHPVTEAALRFATEKKGSKAGPSRICTSFEVLFYSINQSKSSHKSYANTRRFQVGTQIGLGRK
jgi:hypothetical protein